MNEKNTHPGILPVLALLVGMGAMGGCGHEADHPIPNEAPRVEITGGPLDGSRAAYTAKVFWRGWDEDGAIDHFEYAVDPPSVFSLEEIEDPGAYPGIRVRLIRGPTEQEDTLEVTKEVGGEEYSFRWVETKEYDRSFAFETPEADSVSTGSTKEPSGYYTGLHTILVRAQDDDGAYSEMEYLSFTAETVTPTAKITGPEIEGQGDRDFLTVGTTITVSWDGVDPDSPDPQKKPTGYLYRLLDLNTLPFKVYLMFASPTLLWRSEGMDSTWTYQSADTLEHTFFLTLGHSYIFGLRAVDVAGGVQPYLEFSKNVFKFQTSDIAGFPRLTVSEPSLGDFTYLGLDKSYEVEVPVGARLRFTWKASAEDYGGRIDGYSWGVDVADLDREGPGSGWSGWSRLTGNFRPVVFDNPGVHVLLVRARDASGVVTLATLVMNVLDFPLDKQLLLVDDERSAAPETEVDAFWDSLVEDSGMFTSWDRFEAYGAGGWNAFSPKLKDMGRYKLIIWDCSGGQPKPALLQVTGMDNRYLGAYLRAGGKLWLTGTQTVGATIQRGGGPDLQYPKSADKGNALEPGMFAWDFLRLYSDKIDNGKTLTMTASGKTDNNLIAVEPWPDSTVMYPTMEADPGKLTAYDKGIYFCDVVIDPIFAQDQEGFTGQLDSLYVYRTVGARYLGQRGRAFDKKLNAIRWHDPDPDARQGPTQWFGFPMYYWKKEQAQETFNRSIEWFRKDWTQEENP